MRTLRPSRGHSPFSVLFALALLPGAAEAQSECELLRSNFTRSLEMGSGNRITYISGPLLLACADGTRIRADSAQIHSATSFSQLFGNVFFEDAEKELVAERANYFEREGRLVAWGRVVLTDKVNRSVTRGDSLRYLRAGTMRPEDQLTVSGGRTRTTLYPGASATRPPDEEGAEGGAPRNPLPEDAQPPAAPDTEGREPAPDAEGADARRPPPDDARPDVDAPTPDVRAPATVRGEPAVQEEDARGPEAQPEAAVLVAVREGPARVSEAGAAQDTVRVPYEIDADRIVLEGERFFRAFGSVEIRREDMEAFADSAEYDQAEEVFNLRSNARISGDGYDLSGREIVMRVPDDQLRDIVASGDALLTGDDLVLTSPEIRIFLTEGQMERLVAVRIPVAEGEGAEGEVEARLQPPADTAAADDLPARPRRADGQPEAVTADFILIGDSIEVSAPGERLERVFAAGRARGESLTRDTLNQEGTPDFARRDWLEGDTIIALFIPLTRPEGPEAAPADERAELERVEVVRPGEDGEAAPRREGYEVERLIARGNARSLYRVEPTDTVPAEPDVETGAERTHRLALHYVTGSEITVLMKNGEVDRMEVEGPTQGIHLEPQPVARRPTNRPDGEEASSASPAVPPGVERGVRGAGGGLRHDGHEGPSSHESPGEAPR